MATPFWLTKLLVRTRLARFSRRARALTDNGTASLKHYSDKVLAAPVEELLDGAFVPSAPAPDVLDLNQPVPDPPPAKGAVSVGRTDLLCAPGRTPRTLPELAHAITDRARRNGRSLSPATEVLVTHGATGALAAALDALVNPGDRVVLFDPTSPLFILGAKSRHAKVSWVPTWNEDGRLRYIARDFERAMRRAKLLVLCDPANPSGACLAPEDREHIAWIAGGYDVPVLSDESFRAFRTPRARSLGAMPGADRLTLTAGSVSQEFGHTGLRVGWLTGPKHLVRACALTANLAAPYVPPVCQQAAALLLSDADGETATGLHWKRQYALDRLRAMGLEPEPAAGGYFLWVPVSGLGLDGRAFAEQLLRDEKVFVGAGCAFGPSGSGHVRISLACDDGRLREGLKRLGAFVARLKNPTAALPTPEPTEEPKTAAETDARKPAFSRT